MDTAVKSSQPPGSRVSWCDYDIIREIFTYFKSPYDDGYHNGDLLLSYMLVNKVWGAIVQEKIWSRLKSDKPLMRLLMLDYASPQDGGKLVVARCSYKKIRLSRVSDVAIARFNKYTSLVKVLDKTRDHPEALSMTDGEVKMWESLAERLPTPVFPNLRSVGFEFGARGSVPAIFKGARPDTVYATLSNHNHGEDGRGLIQHILDFFPTVEHFHLNSVANTNLRLINEPINQQSSISTLNIRLDQPRDGLMDIYEMLTGLRHPLTLNLNRVGGEIPNLHQDQIPIISSLQNLTIAPNYHGWNLISIIPKAPNLKVFRFIISSHWPNYPVDEIINISAAYQISSPFSTFIYRCDDGGYVSFVDEPKGLLQFKNLLHLEFVPGKNIYLSEQFLHSIVKASPSLRSLKIPSGRYTWRERDITYPLVTLHGILRITRHSPNLEILHIYLDAAAASNKSLWTRQNIDDEDEGIHTSNIKIHISPNDTPPHCLRELGQGNSDIDDSWSVAAVLKKAFPFLHSIEKVERYSLWYNVNRLLSQDEAME